ncbi:MAG: AMIN domain-containing protein, partial [Burkholderiales bacterium]|nr:AMIN domain-containing protein [Burkholderiales bacterium]
MNALINTIKRGAMIVKFALFLLLGLHQYVWAQSNSIESITANQQGANVIVRIGLKNKLIKTPVGFAISDPARIALDFVDTDNETGKTTFEINTGNLRSVNLVEATGRARMVFNLNKSLNYAMTIEGNVLIVTIDGSGGVATAVNSQGLPAKAEATDQKKQNIRDIDFRRGVSGEGRVVVDLPLNQVAVDVKQQGQKIIVDFLKVGLPDVLRRRLDVADFGSPVQTITTTTVGENVRMVIEPKGLWEQSSYQS